MANTKKKTTKPIEEEVVIEESKISDTDMFMVVNNTIGSLSFRDLNDKKITFIKTGSSKMLERRVIKGVYDDSETLITHGHIIFPQVEVYEYLQIPEEIYSKLITKEQIEELLKSNPKEIMAVLKDAPLNIKEKVAITAKEIGIDSKKATKAVEDATGFKIEEEDLLD